MAGWVPGTPGIFTRPKDRVVNNIKYEALDGVNFCSAAAIVFFAMAFQNDSRSAFESAIFLILYSYFISYTRNTFKK